MENCELKTQEQTAKKTLYFEGAGWSGADISKATVGNCRIRTAFHLDNGKAVYLEICGAERTKHSSPELYRWQYTGFVDACFYITDDIPNDDENNHQILHLFRTSSGVTKTFPYTEEGILEIVNSLGASFDAIKVLPDLGGYYVFPEKHSCDGPAGYYYGDEFDCDPEMIARRKAVYNKVYNIEEDELNRNNAMNRRSTDSAVYPNFSLWVDEFDSGLLHLLRHFNGYNKHWTIRTDTGNKLEDWMATMKEARLGSCGC